MRGRVLTRYDNGLLPARQGLLGADDLGGGVTHSRDRKEAVKELASPPGGREHGRATGQRAAGRSGAEAPLRSGRLARRGAARRELRALDAGLAGGLATTRAPRVVPLPPPRNRGYYSASGREGQDRGRVLALSRACAGRNLRVLAPLLYKVPGRRTSVLMAVRST